jgi:acylphosphatase
MIRATITFTGRVQGVGFRATTANVARGFNIAGWVRNEPDGSVKCIAEGEAAEVDRFIRAVQDAMAGCVHETRVERGHALGEARGFSVRY